MPRKNSGPAHRAIPTTMNEKPRIVAVNRPIQATSQKTKRNGSVIKSQTATIMVINSCPRNHEPNGFMSSVLAFNGLSARRCPLSACGLTNPPLTGGTIACLGLGLLHSVVRVNYALAHLRHLDQGQECPERIRRRTHSLVALMDYRGRCGFDKANLMIERAKARRP